MAITIQATYENGVLKPAQPLPFPAQPLPFKEHETVQITVSSASNWVQETAGMLGWNGTSEELAAFALDPEFEYPLAPQQP